MEQFYLLTNKKLFTYLFNTINNSKKIISK